MRLRLAAALMLLPAGAGADQVLVFAASSLTTALTEIETGFEAETGHDAVLVLGATSALARQIQDGAPADVFLSASTDWMDTLDTAGLLEPGTRFDLLGNTLVLIAHGPAAPVRIGPGLDLAGMLGEGRLSMAMVDAVPAGIYAKAALETLGLWPSVEGRVAQSENVRAALALVALGEAPLGIVYASDAEAEGGVSVIGTFPADSHPPIVYPVADIASRDTEAEAAFLTYLRGPAARAVFERQNFAMLTP